MGIVGRRRGSWRRLTGIAQIAAVASDTVAITPRCTVGVKQSGDMTPREALAIPSGSGRDAVNPRN